MRTLVLAAVLVLLAGCASLPLPIVQVWTIVLARGDEVVTTTRATALEPFLTFTDRTACREGVLEASTIAARRCARVRVFRFDDVLRRERIAVYQEVEP